MSIFIIERVIMKIVYDRRMVSDGSRYSGYSLEVLDAVAVSLNFTLVKISKK